MSEGERAARALETRLRSGTLNEASGEWSPSDRLRAIYELLNDNYAGSCLKQCLKAEIIIEMAIEAYPKSVQLARLATLVELGKALPQELFNEAWGRIVTGVERDEDLPDWVKALIKLVKP